MKKTLFAALAAIVAFTVTSCKVELPKAVFSYEVEELTVTFTNLSKNADSYVWNFGDGQTSTEVNPVHTYAKNGEYTVVLTATNKGGDATYSESITMKVAAIKIDGSFADWDAVLANKTVSNAVSSELEAGVEYEDTGVKKFAAYMDADFVYFYLKCDADVMPMDMLFGVQGELVDDDPCTSDWEPLYCDYLLEFGKGDTFDPNNMDWYDWNYSTFFAFDHAAGGWSFNQLSQNICTLSNKVTSGSTMEVEGKVSIANFTLMSKDYIYISCFTSDSDWGTNGHAPAAPMVEGSAVYPAQLKLLFATDK